MRDRWDEADAADARGRWLDAGGDLALRTYSSRLIGADAALVLHGGGNTSVKTSMVDALGRPRTVLAVKGSGWDLASIEPAGFAPVDLEAACSLRARPTLSDDEMVAALRVALCDPSAPNPSIETLLHAFLPHRFVDHSHADAILAVTNREDGAAAAAALGSDLAIVPYVKAGFDLAKQAADAHDAHPGCIGLVLLHHGLFTFGDTARQSYQRHVEVVRRAEAWLAARPGPSVSNLAPDPLRASEQALRVRGAVSRAAGRPMVVVWRAGGAMLGCLEHPEAASWIGSGPLTPDHTIRTKPLGLFVHPEEDVDAAVQGYAAHYRRYVAAGAERAGVEVVPLDPAPRAVWMPGVGLFAVGDSARAAHQVADIAEHTLSVKRWGAGAGRYLPLPDDALFEMEYWVLEQRKLAGRVRPSLGGRVALITGAGGPIGAGIARQLLDAGAHVVLTDVDRGRLDRVAEALGAGDRVASVVADVTVSSEVDHAFALAARAFGGVDLAVVNAGVAHAAPLHDLTDEDLARVLALNLAGGHRTLRAAAQQLRAQGTAGDIVVIGSKNVAGPGADFGAYSASKAGLQQLARVAALELAPLGVRVNVVAPDAVFEERLGDVVIRSQLWDTVGAERAASRGLGRDELPAYYRQRNLLHREISGSDVGRAVVFLAAHAVATTGAVLPVDGGLAVTFSR